MGTVPADLVVVGRITTVFGVKGWVKIHSYTEPMDNLCSFESLYIQRNGQWAPFELTEIKRHQKGLIGLIRGVDDRELARTYCQCDIGVSATEMPALEEGDYYWHQLEGLRVYTRGAAGTEVLLGTVHQILETGANDVMVVRRCAGSLDDRERLIPWLPGQVVGTVDLAAGAIHVDWDSEF